jgi:hypothetical protein
LLALFSTAGTATSRWIWATVGITALAQSTYYVSGAGELNCQRYALDYWPLLFILVAGGLSAEMERGRQTLWKGAIAYSVALNALALAYFGIFARFLSFWASMCSRS